MKRKQKFDRVDAEGDRYFVVPVSEQDHQRITNRVNTAVRERRIKIVLTNHAQIRMDERDIDYADIRNLLAIGKHVQTRCYKKRPENLRQLFKGKDHDNRRVISAAIVEEGSLVVVTVMN